MNILPKVSHILFIDVIPCLTYELQTGGTMDLLNPMFQQILIYSTSPVDIGSLSLSLQVLSRDHLFLLVPLYDYPSRRNGLLSTEQRSAIYMYL